VRASSQPLKPLPREEAMTCFMNSFLSFKGTTFPVALRITLLAFVLAVSACSQDVKIARLPANATILSFGDSLTSGVGVRTPDSYPSVLAKLTGLNVVNAGIPGELTQEGLGRLPGLLDDISPSLLILVEGGNDILKGYDLTRTRANLANMIREAQERYIPVVLLGVPERSLFSSSAPFYSELAEEYQVVFDDDLLAGLLKSTAYKSDAVHFNEAGYRVMAEGIYDLLVESGAL
jgi:acyl-CoA thioesterase-1